MYLSDCNSKRSIYYRKRGEEDITCRFRENKRIVLLKVMIITGFCYNRKHKIRRVEKNVKINSNLC